MVKGTSLIQRPLRPTAKFQVSASKYRDAKAFQKKDRLTLGKTTFFPPSLFFEMAEIFQKKISLQLTSSMENFSLDSSCLAKFCKQLNTGSYGKCWVALTGSATSPAYNERKRVCASVCVHRTLVLSLEGRGRTPSLSVLWIPFTYSHYF